MTFLQPFVLLGLPLVLLPVIIHLLNRLRHRPHRWGAMEFILAATRSSVDRHRLRQFLVLLFRTLAVLALILFLSRPFAGGWLGWAVSAAPDVIVLLVDRSASMEHMSAGGSLSRREELLHLMIESARDFEERSHLVLIDSATRQPQSLARLDGLLDHPLTRGTDTAADIPAMLQSALSWLLENRSGNVEIWIGSDLQTSNWDPDPERWVGLVQDFDALPQKVRFRLFAMRGESERRDLSLHLVGDVRRIRGGEREASFTLETLARGIREQEVRAELDLGGVITPISLDPTVASHRWNHRVPLGSVTDSGWGAFRLSPDANNRNNDAYFVYGRSGDPAALVVATDPVAEAVLRLAAADFGSEPLQWARQGHSHLQEESAWEDRSLVVWQDRLPDEEGRARLETFVRAGGSVLVLPPDGAGAGTLGGIRWGPVEEAPARVPFLAGRWERLGGPLADTDEGMPLPLDSLEVYRRRSPVGKGLDVVAAFRDGAPLLVRQGMGRGAFWFLATLPRLSWSTLADGGVLIPMAQRLREAGTRRLETSLDVVAGEWPPGLAEGDWEPVASRHEVVPRRDAGIYRKGEQWLSVNRPAREDQPGEMDPEEVRSLFGTLSLSMQEEQADRSRPMQGEVWRFFLFGMLLFLLAESFLTLPPAVSVNPLSPGRAA